MAVNCAAFPETLIEAELFGFERGAFTGAVKKREGRFRAADGGTLFLDEIAELPPSAQAKLLRVLQDGMVEPLGTDVPVKVDVRVISATHRNLRENVAQRLFREDLFYRINVLDLSLPPLREREGNLPVLIQFFLDGFPRIDGGGQRVLPVLSSDAYAALSAYRFPGNVRELAHAIEHAVVLAGGGEITLDHLPAVIAEAAPASIPVPSSARRRTARRRWLLGRWSPPLANSKRFIFVAPWRRRAASGSRQRRCWASRARASGRSCGCTTSKKLSASPPPERERSPTSPDHAPQDSPARVGWHVFCVPFRATMTGTSCTRASAPARLLRRSALRSLARPSAVRARGGRRCRGASGAL